MMKKLLITLSLVILTVIGATMPSLASGNEYFTRASFAMKIVEELELEYTEDMTIPFKDVPAEHEAYEAICILYQGGYMTGFSETKYSPNTTMNRSEVAVVLTRIAALTGGTSDLPTDVSGGAWFAEPICAVVQNGLMFVDNTGAFKPHDYTRESDIDYDKLSELIRPDTYNDVSIDLSQGSIDISQNICGTLIYRQGDTVIKSGSDVCLIRQSGGTTSNCITVDSAKLKISLAGVRVETSAEISSPISVAGKSDLTLNLVGSNTVSAAGKNSAGIYVYSDATLTISGTGTITASGGNRGVGIGNGSGPYGYISITSGTIVANGGKSAPGIGGGGGCEGGTICISGGNITATGGSLGAGIGGDVSDITISGGTIIAYGGDYGAGIGQGSGGAPGNDGSISITGGTVEAFGGRRAAGIGGCGEKECDYGTAGNVSITGGTVTAVGGEGSAGIARDDVFIGKATVSARGYYFAIGSSNLDNAYGCGSIEISKEAKITLLYEHEDGSECQERIDINTQPTDCVATAGNRALTEINAYGFSGLDYQWQILENSIWTDVDDQTAAQGYIPVNANDDEIHFRCKLTNSWGNTIYSESATAHVLAFSKHPIDSTVWVGETAVLEASSTCEYVSYQWVRSYDDGQTWSEIDGETYPILLLSTTLSDNGTLYRCIITATNGDELSSNTARLTVNSSSVNYTTNFYLEEIDGSYTLMARETLSSEPGVKVFASERNFAHYTENTEKGVLTGTVVSDGSLTLSRYYERDEYSIIFDVNDGVDLPAIIAKHGTTVMLPNTSRYGYIFEGWYVDEALTTAATITTMPTENTTLYAKWTAVGANRGIEYRINSISVFDKSYRPLDSIPDERFYAQVSITNVESVSMDTLILAAYNEQGRMLDLYFLTASPQIGQTYALGAFIDNSAGEIAILKAFVMPMLGGVLIPLANCMAFPY